MKAFFNLKELDILLADVNMTPFQEITKTSCLYFDFDEPGVLEIEYDTAPKSMVIRPLKNGCPYELNGNKMRIFIDKPCNFSVEADGNAENAILVFAGSINKKERADYEHFIYFPKGEHTIDCYEIPDSNTLLYIDEGAVVNGKIVVKNKDKIAIDGMGILTMKKYSMYGVSIYIENCFDVCVQNLLILDSCNFHCMLVGCENVYVNNLRFLSFRGNSDGIDVCGSRNVMVENLFARVWDDGLVVKGMDTGNIENVTFRNCILWNDFARPMEMGVSLRADEVKNVRFENIDVIHSLTGYPIMGIHHGDRADVHDVYFENIRIEDIPGAQIVDIRIHTGSVYNKDVKKGKIHNIYFKNIELEETGSCKRIPMKSRIQGYSEEHDIKDIYFENIKLYGKTMKNPDDFGMEIKEYVSNVQFTNTENVKKAHISTNITESKKFIMNDDGYYEGSVCVNMKNTGNAQFSGDFELEVYPKVRSKKVYSANVTIKPGEEKNIEFDIVLSPGKTIMYLQSENIEMSTSRYFVNLELNLYPDKVYTYRFEDCFGNRVSDISMSFRNGLIIINDDDLKKHEFTIYSALIPQEQRGEIIFSVEETNIGMSPALIRGSNGYELAPQIGCTEEIDYVYRNQPKTEVLKYKVIKNSSGTVMIPLSNLGMKDQKRFLLEIEISGDAVEAPKKFPMTLFGSQIPGNSAHMYVTVNL